MPKPEIQILVCTNERPIDAPKPSCAHRNGLALYHRFKDRAKELGLRDQVMVTRTGCLKHCSQGVTVAVQPLNCWYAGVSDGDVDEILGASERGEEVARLRMPDVPWE